MLMDAAYYYRDVRYYEDVDYAPPGQLLFVISAGHYKPLTLDFFDTVHDSRSDYQVLFVKQGCIHYLEDGQEQIAPAGSCLIYRPKEYQRYKYFLKEHADIFWVHFNGSATNLLLQNNTLLNARVVESLPAKRTESLFKMMISNLKSIDEYSNQLNSLHINELLLTIARAKNREIVKNEISSEYLKAVKYVDDHLSKKLTLLDIATYANVSTKTLTRYFEKYQNMSPMKYVNFSRIEKAKILLQSNNSIGQIAAALGFEDPLYFSTVFRRYVGLSPEKYRKSLKK